MITSACEKSEEELCPLHDTLCVLTPVQQGMSIYPPQRLIVPFLYRGWFQIILFTLYAFCTIGPYNGLNALGGGGLKDHLAATKLNCVYAGSLCFWGWLGGACFNYWGCRVVAIIANTCYFLFVLVLILITFANFPTLIVFPVGFALGFGSALFWASFGAVSIRYTTLRNQSRSFLLCWSFANLGGFACGLLSLVMNFNSNQAEANFYSYVALATIVLVGFLIAVGGLRHHELVFRSDGTAAGNSHVSTIKKTMLNAVGIFNDQQLRSLWPIFLAPYAHMPFLFNGLNGHYFNIRSRSFNSSVYWLSRIPGGCLFYWLLREGTTFNQLNDNDVRKCMARRLLPGFYLTFMWSALSLALCHFSIFDSFGTLPPPAKAEARIDFIEDFPKSLLPMIPFCTLGMLDAFVQSFLYNLLGYLAGDDSQKAALYSGFYKSFQSLTLCVMWGFDWFLSSGQTLSYAMRYQLHWAAICIVWLAAFPGTLHKLLKIRRMPHTDTAQTWLEESASIPPFRPIDYCVECSLPVHPLSKHLER